MTALKKVESHPDVVDYFNEPPFYKPYIEKPKIKRLKKHWFVFELPFYEELNIIKTNHVFKEYAMSYKVKIVEKERSNYPVRNK